MAPTDDLTLEIRGVLPATRDRVFKALTDPDDLAYWWGPDGFKTEVVASDLRAGGRYRFAMQPPEGELFYLTGEFREVVPPERLSYPFVWEDPDPDDRETLVTLSLSDRGEETEVEFDQSSFATVGRYELHRDGWTEGFARLRELLDAESG